MLPLIKAGVVICVLFSVIAVLICPVIDLQPTALRAVKISNLLLAGLTLAALVSLSGIPPVIRHRDRLPGTRRLSGQTWDLFDLNCARLC